MVLGVGDKILGWTLLFSNNISIKNIKIFRRYNNLNFDREQKDNKRWETKV